MDDPATARVLAYHAEQDRKLVEHALMEKLLERVDSAACSAITHAELSRFAYDVSVDFRIMKASRQQT